MVEAQQSITGKIEQHGIDREAAMFIDPLLETHAVGTVEVQLPQSRRLANKFSCRGLAHNRRVRARGPESAREFCRDCWNDKIEAGRSESEEQIANCLACQVDRRGLVPDKFAHSSNSWERVKRFRDAMLR